VASALALSAVFISNEFQARCNAFVS